MENDVIIQALSEIAAKAFQTSTIFMNFVMLRVLDLISLIFNLLAICTIVRIPAIFYVIKMKLNQSPHVIVEWINLWRLMGLFQVIIFIIDVPFMIMALPLGIFFWRAILLYKEHGPVTIDDENLFWGFEGLRLRKLIWKHFCLLCTDFFFLPFSFCLLISWRGPRFLQLLHEHYGGDELVWKKMIVKEFLMLLNELFCFLVIVCLIKTWRSRNIHCKIEQSFNSQITRGMTDLQIIYSLTKLDIGDAFCLEWSIVLSETCNFTLDIITLPMICVLMISWRATIVWDLFKPWYQYNITKSLTQQLYHSELYLRVFIGSQFFGGLLIDLCYLPFLITILLSWRGYSFCTSAGKILFYPLLSSEINKHHCPTRRHLTIIYMPPFDAKLSKLRQEIFQSFCLYVTDLVCILSFLVIAALFPFFSWRLYHVLSQTYNYNDSAFKVQYVKSIIFKEFYGLLIVDFPTSLALLVIILSVWRLPFVVSDVFTILYEKKKEGLKIIPQVIFKHLWYLLLDVLTAPFIFLTIFTLWRLKPFWMAIKKSKKQHASTIHWQYYLSIYDGNEIRSAAVYTVLCILAIDVPCLCLLILNTIFLLRLPRIVSSLLSSSSFYSDYPIVIITESVNLLVDIMYILLGIFLLVFRPVAVVVHLLEDEKHQRNRILNESIDIIKHFIRKAQKCTSDLEETNNILVKCCGSSEYKMDRFLLSKVTLTHMEVIENFRRKLMNAFVDERFIYLLSKYLFLFDKHAYFMYRRYLIEKKHLKRPSYYARFMNLQLFKSEYDAYMDALKSCEGDLLNFNVEKIPLWGEEIGFMERSSKENQVVLINTVTSGNFAIFLCILMNCVLIFRAIPLFIEIHKEPYLVHKKAIKNLHEYWLDLKCLFQISIVLISIYRCPDLISDLIIDIFYKRSISAIRKTVSSYPPEIKKDILTLISLSFQWKTVAYFISSTLFFIFIPLSGIIYTVKSFSGRLSIDWRVVVCSASFYLLGTLAPIGLIFERDNEFKSQTNYLFYYFAFILLLLIFSFAAHAKKIFHLPPLDYVSLNWGLFQIVFYEILQLSQILCFLFSCSLKIDQQNTLRGFFKMFIFEADSPNGKLSQFYFIFSCWFFISSVPIVLEGILKYVPAGRFSNNNISWQFALSFFGSTMFIIIPHLGLSYLLSCDTTGKVVWYDHKSEAIWCFILLVWYLLTSNVFYVRYVNTHISSSELQFSPNFNVINNLLKLTVLFMFKFLELSAFQELFILLACVIIMILITINYNKIMKKVFSVSDQLPCNSNLLKMWHLTILFVLMSTIFICIAVELVPELVNIGYNLIHITLFLLPIMIIGITLTIKSESPNEEARNKFTDIVCQIENTMIKRNKNLESWYKTQSGWHKLLKVVRLANEDDKNAEDFIDNIFHENISIVEEAEAPPIYDQLHNQCSKLPSYSEINRFSTPDDFMYDDFVPDNGFLFNPVGNWQPFSSHHHFDNNFYLNEVSELTQTITDKKCTGSNILLILEKHIHYQTLTRVCVQNINIWRSLVTKSNWPGLVKYASMLLKAMTNEYDIPRNEPGIVTDLTDDDFLNPMLDKSYFPDYIQEESLFNLKLRVHKQKRDDLLCILSPHLSKLFGLLIPENIPIIKSISVPEASDNTSLTCDLFQETQIIIVSVSGSGYKFAAGTKIILPAILKLSKISHDSVYFQDSFPVASKWFFKKDISLIKVFQTDNKTEISIDIENYIKADYDKVTKTLADLQWKL